MPSQLRCIKVLGSKNNSHVELCTRPDGTQTVIKYYPKISRAMLIETSILATVNHRNVMGLIDIVSDPDRSPTVICLPVGGPTLADVLRSRPIPLTVKVALLLQIAYGLRHTHANGILHLDLKADNVLVDSLDPPACRLIDFGTSEYLVSGHSSLNTYQTKCTATYRAPEGFTHRDECATVGLAADIWSFGIITHELLTGLPFPSNFPIFEELRDSNDRDEDLYSFIHSSEFRSAVTLILPPGLDSCLLSDPKLRPCINQVIHHLTNYLDTLDPNCMIPRNFDTNLELKNSLSNSPVSICTNWYANCLYSRAMARGPANEHLIRETCEQICERILDYQLISTVSLDADAVAEIIHASRGVLYHYN